MRNLLLVLVFVLSGCGGLGYDDILNDENLSKTDKVKLQLAAVRLEHKSAVEAVNRQRCIGEPPGCQVTMDKETARSAFEVLEEGHKALIQARSALVINDLATGEQKIDLVREALRNYLAGEVTE